MAIQFHCPGCGQPIEVDEVHGGKSALCPYCQRLVTVPTQSTVDAASVVARPLGSAAPPPPPPPERGIEASYTPYTGSQIDLHVGDTLSPAAFSARQFGRYALICSGLAVLVFALMVGISMMALWPEVPKIMQNPTTRPSQEELERLLGSARPTLLAMQLGAGFFGLAGLVLGIVSMTQMSRGNWRGILSIVVCGLITLCFCTGTVIGLIQGG